MSSETAARVEVCSRYLREQGLAAAVFVSPANMFYLTGIMFSPYERLIAVVVGAHGELSLVVPELDREAALEVVGAEHVFIWRDGESAVAALARALSRLDLPSLLRLGVERNRLTLGLAQAIMSEFPQVEFCDVEGPLLSRLRAVKSEEEVKRIWQACAITVSVFREALSWIRPGLAELEVAGRLEQLLKSAGAEKTSFTTQVLSGIRAALPHGQSSRKEIAQGDVVVIDMGAVYGGYCADFTRTVVMGRASPGLVKVHETVALAQKEGMAAARPGVRVSEVDRAARKVVSDAGYGDRFLHRTGHGIGIEVHEEPSLTSENSQELQTGMVITVEPGVYVPSWGGVRIEDVVVITSDGSRVLTDASRELLEL